MGKAQGIFSSGNGGSASVSFSIGPLNPGYITFENVVVAGALSSALVQFACVAVDETDVNWAYWTTIDGSSDPAIATLQQIGSSRKGRSLAVGDYLVANDTTNGYEILQVLAINDTEYTLSRALFGSTKI